MILAKFGQKLLAVENSAGIALGCIEADFLRFESSGIARRCAQPLPQHHFAILNKSAKIIFAYICLFHNRITFLAFSDRVLFFPPEDLSLSTHDVFRCVCRESGVVLRLARSGGCSIRAGGVGQKAYRLKIQDSKTQKLMTQLSTDCAMTSHPLLTALLLIRFYLETVDLSVVQSRGCPQWCAENSNADCIRAHRPVPGAVPWRRAQNSHNVQRYALTHSPTNHAVESAEKELPQHCALKMSKIQPQKII